MNNEFKIKKYNNATVYTLESASSGGTSAGGVASVSMPMGGTRKRGDNLIAQEADKKTVPASTPRNFVAKNAKTGGAGAHRDKKKEQKQGVEKHKKPFMEDHADAANGWGAGSYDTYAGGRHGRGVAENPEWYSDEANSMSTSQLKSLYKHAIKLRQAVQKMQQQGDTLEPWQQSKVTKAADYLDAVFNAVDDEHDMGEDQGVAEGDASKAQAGQDLGNGFVLTTVDVFGRKFKVVLDTQSDIHYLPNRNESGGAIVRSMAPFITIKNGQANTTMSVGPATQAAMKKAGLLKGVEESVAEEWSQKYKSSINCSHPKGFSQKAHCAGKKKHNESMMTMEATCPDCGMCQTHGNINEIKKGAKDSNGFTKCWPGKHAVGTKKGKNGGQVRNCQPNEDMEEGIGKWARNAALAGALAVGAMGAHADVKDVPAGGHNLLPDIVAHVTFKVGDKEISKEINLGSHYRSPGEAGEELKKFLDSKGIKFYQYSLERVKPTNNYLDSSPAAGTGNENPSIDTKEPASNGKNTGDYMAKEDAYMESLENMLERSVSQAQHNLMVGVAHNPQFAQQVKVKQKVGQEFADADVGHDISKLPIRVPKKK